MTAPFVDPMFSQTYARELSAAEELLRDHWGHGYLAPAVSASGEHRPPAPPAPGVLTAETTVDANRSAPPSIAEGSAAPPSPPEPGRLSLHAASEALRLLIEAQRRKT